MADAAPRSADSRMRAVRAVLGVATVVVVLAALRLPSLFEPTCSPDSRSRH